MRRRLLVFQGDDVFRHDDVWALSLSGVPQWTKLEPRGPIPQARHGQSAVYDPVQDRVIVYGGEFGNSALDDVWALSLSGDPAWTQLTPLGGSPSGRTAHRAVYDPDGRRMIVIGGYDHRAALSDVWSLSLGGDPSWSRLVPGGPSFGGRYGHSAVLDPTRDRIVVFGGYGGIDVGQRGDVWALSLDASPAWTSLTPGGSAPSGRSGHTAQLDPAGDRMVVFGGYDGRQFLSDTWSLSLAGAPAWTLVTTPCGTPSPRHGAATAVDSAGRELVLFGGYGGPAADVLQDVWAFDLSGGDHWRDLTPVPPGPPRRSAAAAVHDPVRDVMWMYGARYGETGLWRLALEGPLVWTHVATSGEPPLRAEHSAIYDGSRDRMIVFGGYGQAVYGDLWYLDLARLHWTQVMAAGAGPTPRHGHLAFCDSVRSRMLVLGGFDSTGAPLGDVWSLSLGTAPEWQQIVPAGIPPPPRGGHAGVYDPIRDRLLLFGGAGGGVPTSPRAASRGMARAIQQDLRELSLAGDPVWSEIVTQGASPGPRVYASMVLDGRRDRAIMFGGADGQSLRNDVW